MQILLFGDEINEDNSKITLKCKNIRQTGKLKFIDLYSLYFISILNFNLKSKNERNKN